jgi:hypothetical protein
VPDTEAAVILPFAGDCPHRTEALAFVRRWYARHFPTWPCHVAFGPSDPWCKAQAVMPLVRKCSLQVVIVADADVYCDGLREAVEAVRAGVPWAVPHKRVVRLDAKGTGHDEPPYEPLIGGGLLVARRDVLRDVPLDSRFRGWGGEDESWGLALRCLFGEPWQGKSDLIHLWHPPQERMTRRIGNEANWQLRRRYRRARGDPAAMRELLQEAR